MWLEQFYPDECAESVYQIDFSEWYKEALAMQKHRPSPSIMKKGSDAYASLCVV